MAEMLCFLAVVMPDRLMSLFLVDYCRVTLTLCLVICQLLRVRNLGDVINDVTLEGWRGAGASGWCDYV